ncbi:MAG: UDP-N-acetylmuramate--L-alanine ligase [Pseudomonadota bacterium]|nr:UDP-N-acetylmuramate--L-alanine ligase [Pseudomonadota bacterium]
MTISLDAKRKIHFVGIGGAGMGGIAEVLLTQGHAISGSDMGENAVTERLLGLGAQIHIGHAAKNVNGADIVVLSSAITLDNPEWQVAKQKGVKILKRAQMLALLMQAFQGIAVAGTHGKTTTTSLVASVLAEAGRDPTFVIGGLLKSAGCNAQLGTSCHFVAEADESDASFLYLQPEVAVVTNIDADHLCAYQGDFSKLKSTFVEFLNKIPPEGAAVICGDDPVNVEILPQLHGRVIRYGFGAENTIRAEDYVQRDLVAEFTLCDDELGKKFPVKLALAGRHNVLNALAAYAVGRFYDVAPEEAIAAFAKFQGVGRRFQLLGDLPIKDGHISLIDDYGHHPRELQVTIDAVRQVWPTRRLTMVFQPHRYSRTAELMDDFIDVLAQVDQLILCEIYPASEAPIPGVSGEILAARLATRAHAAPVFVEDLDSLPNVLSRYAKEGDVVLVQGAGSIGKVARYLADHPDCLINN